MIVDCAIYEEGVRRPGALAIDSAREVADADRGFVWIGLHEPNETEFESVRHEFALHELAVEDAIKAHQRPKLEVYGGSLFVVLKAAQLEPGGTVGFAEVQLFIGAGFLITVRHGEGDLRDVRTGIESRPDFLRCGPGAAVHAIVDRVVDDYEPVIESLDQQIGDLEIEVFSPSRSNPAERIYTLKREVLEVHNALTPLLEPLETLARGRHELVGGPMLPYFRDVHDHLLRLVAQVEGFREVLTSILTANLTQASVRQNQDVRRISAWAAIIAVPTMVAGIYGMNFKHMPELGWTFGYPLVIGVIVVVCLALYLRLRRAGWL